MNLARLLPASLLPVLVLWPASGALRAAQTPPAPESPGATVLPLTDASDLVLVGGNAEPVEYRGRRAIRLTTPGEQVFAFVKGLSFRDGTIDVDIATHITAPPGVRMPGFTGVAFRARPDGTHYDMFYLRPGNASSDDQAMRNHAVQYVAAPDFDWNVLRRQWPFIYESWADLHLDAWTPVRIEVRGRVARLYVNGSLSPGLIVDGLKGEDLEGGVALWGYAGEEAYFSNLRITPAAPEPIHNGGEATGKWAVSAATDVGPIRGTMQLVRHDTSLEGTWSGDLGSGLPIHGSWRNGYVELTFDGVLPSHAGTAPATFAGWIDGDAARGRMKVEGHADGHWTAVRKTGQ